MNQVALLIVSFTEIWCFSRWIVLNEELVWNEECLGILQQVKGRVRN